MSLKDGTMAWHLAGFEVVNGATRRPPDVSGRVAGCDRGGGAGRRTLRHRRIDRATLALWRAEADGAPSTCSTCGRPRNMRPGISPGRARRRAASSCRKPTPISPTWNARVVLVDDNGVRATMTASWLKQMGWNDVAVLVADASAGDWMSGAARAARARARRRRASRPSSRPRCGTGWPPGNTAVVDLDTSRNYAQGPYSGRLVRDPLAPRRRARQSSRRPRRSC